MLQYLRLVLCSGTALAVASAALAAPAPLANAAAASGNYTYRVQSGESARKLASDYFVNRNDKAAYAALLKLNHLSSDRLTAGSTIQIPRRFLNRVPARAVVAAYRGTVSLGSTRPIKINSVVTEGARIETGPDSSVSFLLEDGSLITLPSQSVFVLERLRLVLLSGELEHVFRLEKGRSQFTVTPSRGPESRFQVRTPVSVSAVRGTEFRIEVDQGGASALAEVLKDNVEVTGATPTASGGVMVNEGFGNKSTSKGVGQPVKLLPFPQVKLPLFHNADGTVTINITPIDGAVRYRLQVANDLTFQDIREEVDNDKPFFGLRKTPMGSYFLKITAVDANGLEGMQHIYPFEYHR
jgi:hypothetical protein